MGSDPETLVTEFHKKYGLAINLTNSEILGLDDLTVRENLIREEYDEVMEAIMHLAEAMEDPECDTNDVEGYHENVLKELCDLVYVVVGTAVSWDYDFETAFARVHASNMSKDGSVNDDGKMTKGPSYSIAHMEDCVWTQDGCDTSEYDDDAPD
jgi:predicted HAD superfamily Cof-like phosphohydrolase